MPDPGTPAKKPWLDPQWNGGRIESQGRLGMKVLIFMAVLWNGISMPMAYMIWTREPTPEAVALAAASLFPLVGLGLLYAVGLQILRWRRFGELVLEMDPFPGSLAGDVGGSLRVPLRWDPSHRFEVILDCSHVRISRNSKGNSRSERVVWRERGQALAEPTAIGTRIHFRFQVPQDLPQSEPASDNYHHWQVHVSSALAGADLKSSFEIPVYDTGEPLQSRARLDNTAADSSNTEVPAGTAVLSRGSDHKRIYYPLRRNRGMGMMLVFFALFWNGIVYFAGGKMWGDIGDSFMGIMLIPFALIFGGVGLLLAIAAIYTLFNSLEVRLYRDRIDSTRRFFGIPFRKSVPVRDLVSLQSRITSQSGTGASARIYYSLHAITRAGGKIPLGDGILGAPLAKRFRQLISETLDSELEWKEDTRGGLRARRRKSREAA